MIRPFQTMKMFSPEPSLTWPLGVRAIPSLKPRSFASMLISWEFM